MPRSRIYSSLLALISMALVLSTTGCGARRYAPELATRSYPVELHQAESVDIQVFRRGTRLELANATARSYENFDLWLNQRYTHHVDALPAGGRLRLSLWDFRDDRGEAFNAGGFWRTTEPTPVRLVQIQTSDTEPLIGLISIPAETSD